MGNKIAGPALLVGTLWIVGGSAISFYMARLHEAESARLRETMAAGQLADELEATLWRLHSAALDAGRFGRTNLAAGGSEAEMRFARGIESLGRVASSDAERLGLAEITESFARYRSAVHELLAAPQATATVNASQSLDNITHLAALVASACKEFSGLERNLFHGASSQYDRLSRSIGTLRLILITSGPVIGVLLGIAIMRNRRASERAGVYKQETGMGLEKEPGQVKTGMAGAPAPPRHAAGSDRANRTDDATRPDDRVAAGDLAAGIAHELRNPLTSLKLLIQAAARKQRDRPLSDKQFQILQDEIARMEGSIQSLLDFTRPPQMRRRLHNVCDTLRRSLNLVRTRAGQNGVNILEGLPNERIMVDGDAEQLHQVFVNLLLNGMEAMPDGGTLRVAIGGIEDDDTVCRIKCSDTGKGIPEDMLDRIFEPFVSGKEHGHGLGLAVSRRIVAEHGGSITATNREEGGSLFTVALPFVSIDREEKPAGTEPNLEPPAAGISPMPVPAGSAEIIRRA